MPPFPALGITHCRCCLSQWARRATASMSGMQHHCRVSHSIVARTVPRSSCGPVGKAAHEDPRRWHDVELTRGRAKSQIVGTRYTRAAIDRQTHCLRPAQHSQSWRTAPGPSYPSGKSREVNHDHQAKAKKKHVVVRLDLDERASECWQYKPSPQWRDLHWRV